jgi:hypothetical protein
MSRLNPLRESFNFHSKTINAEIVRLRSLLVDPIEKVASACKAHEKAIGGLSNICMQTARVPANSQNLQRAIAEFDDRLDKANTQYLQFRAKYIEYYRARDPLFEQVDALATAISKDIRTIIEEAWAVDASVVGDGKRHKFTERTAAVMANSGADDEAIRVSGNFMVTVDLTVEVSQGRTITGNDVYVLIDANGDDWQVRDKDGNVWSVPAECIVPMPK